MEALGAAKVQNVSEMEFVIRIYKTMKFATLTMEIVASEDIMEIEVVMTIIILHCVVIMMEEIVGHQTSKNGPSVYTILL